MSFDPSVAPLVAALLDIERHVGHGGWDQPARLFALVETDAFIAAEPQLAKELGLRGSADGAPAGALTSIEQEDFHQGATLGEALAQIGWPETVAGCAIAIERTFLPDDAEFDLPDDPAAAARAIAQHPGHDELRIVAGVVRTSQRPQEQCVARLRKADELLTAPDLVPDLTAALAATLEAELDPDA